MAEKADDLTIELNFFGALGGGTTGVTGAELSGSVEVSGAL